MNRISFNYDISYNPSMPVAEVVIRKLQAPQERILEAIIDSGADVTMVPERYLQSLKIAPSAWAQLRGIAGISYRAPVYTVFLMIGPIRVGAVRVVGDRHNEQMILGRDVLNLLQVNLNGLASVVEMSD